MDGTALPLRGDDIDTDRIMPARFLRVVSFDGLEAHVFEDDRRAVAAGGRLHPFDDPAYAGATVLVVNRNFGCGSSREHAPQGLVRKGVRAVVGESFAEIFFSNATAIGLPCVSLRRADVAALQGLVEQEPGMRVSVDLAAGEVRAASHVWPASMPHAAREAFVSGTWDATALLLDNLDEVRRVADRLPYVTGF
ncbi:MAG: 3-isopropylmalate dehydratase small subunit [Acidobacteriota bacterium]